MSGVELTIWTQRALHGGNDCFTPGFTLYSPFAVLILVGMGVNANDLTRNTAALFALFEHYATKNAAPPSGTIR